MPDKHHPKWHWDFKKGEKFGKWENYTPDGIKIPEGSIYGKDFNPAVNPLSMEAIMENLRRHREMQEYQRKLEQYQKDMEKYKKEKKEYDEKMKKYAEQYKA